MSAKKKAAGKAAKRAKPAKRAKGRAAKAGTSARTASKKPVARKAAARKPAAKKVVAKKVVAKKVVAKKLAAKKPVAKKLVAKKPAKAASKANGKPAPMKRRDGAGHLDPAYAADLRARSSKRSTNDDRAFDGDALSEELGEEFVETVTSGEDEGTEIRDQRVTEELGGPFTVTTGGTEFGGDVDASNPKGATREPFPRT